jgi:2'-hydroxyisoflavone reductase
MRVLVLGGTVFVGRHVVEEALRRGHALTLFNRGESGPELYPGVEQLRGERSGDLAALRGRSFDAAIDTSGYFPGDVERSAQLLAPSVGGYVFVSTRSVYADVSVPGRNEDAPLAELPEGAPLDELGPGSYGPLKALCEREVERAFGERAAILRPGLIVGPYDPTNRFAYWPRRIAMGGDVLAPAPPEAAVQVIDARDLAAFALDLLEREVGGTYDVVAPAGTLTLGGVLETCRAVSASDARLVWVDAAFLLERGVEPWTELPLWTPGPEHAGFQRGDVSRALAAGLRVRPLAATAADTLAWETFESERPWAPRLGIGHGPLTAERERDLLAEWAAAHSGR